MNKKYVDYIKNTNPPDGKLEIAFFDDDWDPIGPMIRKDLKMWGLIDFDETHVWVTEAGKALKK